MSDSVSDDLPRPRAVRAVVAGAVQGVGLREATRRRACELGVMGWVRNATDGIVTVHAEGPPAALDALVAFLRGGPRGAAVENLLVEEVPVEGHEQFAIRGLSAGLFLVRHHAAGTRHFDLRLQVDGAMRSWALPKGPSLDPSARRLAVQVPDHPIEDDDPFEGTTAGGGVIVWDRGHYEQGGRVAWPEALQRGHAVFVLHGHKLRGGFVLQRTRPGANPHWLLLKRRDEEARPGSDILAEQPESVLSGLTLEEVLGRGR